MHKHQEVKLHLGCGERYLDGYVNIDFPMSSHTVQRRSVADIHADLQGLRFQAGMVGEVRLHHVFEHFQRPTACALLASWFSWLRSGGKLYIEVPDFRKAALTLLNPFVSLHRHMIVERHLFGSHEAEWAAHREGYTPAILQRTVAAFGFEEVMILRNSWRGTNNIELMAKRSPKEISREKFEVIAEDFLRGYLLDDSESEQRLLNVWMDMFRMQVGKSWAEDE